MKIKNIYIVILCTLILAACSTKKAGWGNKAYHNVTAKYNALYNGEIALKEGVQEFEKNYKDDYAKVLPVFKVTTEKTAQTMFPACDRAMTKGAMVIKRHSIRLNGKEHTKYVDNAYYLIGKAYYYKRDYYAANDMFNYVHKNYKKDSKFDKSKYAAKIMLLRSYNEIGDYIEGQSIIDYLQKKKLSLREQRNYYPALADFYIKQKEYAKATDALNKAINVTKNKKDKSRYQFVLGQLFQKNNDCEKASNLFAKVAKRSSSSFEMAFNSNINLANCYTGNGVNPRTLLRKMLKDDKNTENLDQIHYALGRIEEKDKNYNEAISEYKKSVRTSQVNVQQKGLSYLALADLFYNQSEYVLAQKHYDSASISLNKEYERYDEIVALKNSLGELVINYNNIELQDSLQKLSKLSEKELDLYLDKIIEKQEEEALRKQQEEEDQKLVQANANLNNTTTNFNQQETNNGEWYFYNANTRSIGFSNFRKIWGDRKLEDNWRRSTKQGSSTGVATRNPDDDISNTPIASISSGQSISKASKDNFKRNIPRTPAQFDKSNDIIGKALYVNGTIYRERLKNNTKAVQSFEELLRRFPSTNYKLQAYYNLYRSYTSLNDKVNADKYKNLILTEFPNSDYAKLILDPNYYAKIKEAEKEADALYEKTYQLFQNKNYLPVITNADTALSKFPNHSTASQFAYLRTLSLGYTTKNDTLFKKNLEKIKKDYPTSPIVIRVSQILDAISAKENALKDSSKVDNKIEVKNSTFTFSKDEHSMFIVLGDKKASLNTYKNELSKFNTKYYSLANIKISSTIIEGLNVIMVDEFETSAKAKEYSAAILSNKVFDKLDGNKLVEYYYINDDNYKLLVQQKKSLESYITFFKTAYK